jgi:hypothetical protein
MNRFIAASLLLWISLVPIVRGAEAISPSSLEAYYNISEALAADSLAGVAENAQRFAAAVKDPALHLGALNVAAATLVNLAKTREMFMYLSTVLANGIKFGDYKIAQGAAYRVYCPMKNADWLQAAKTPIHNPYHGSEMLECGEVMATYEAKP